MMVPEPREDWRSESACLGTTPDWFYAEVLRRDTSAPRVKFYNEMRWRELCPTCPVRDQCLAHAILHRERWGVWGGLTPAARRNIEEFLVEGTVTWVQLTRRWSNNGS
jgi:WhiB family redox-sensing transcriptional regulator